MSRRTPPQDVSRLHQFPGVMVSSTFIDLEKHRAELMDALRKSELFAIGMENYSPRPDDDVISSSLEMVGKASAYIGLISLRYGQVITCPIRNPHNYSITRLEFEEAQRLDLPTLVFVMDESHQTQMQFVELDPERRRQLEEFRDAAKEGRIYISFDSLESFTKTCIHGIGNLRTHIERQAISSNMRMKKSTNTSSQKYKKVQGPRIGIPKPPTFYAEPDFIVNNRFVGRRPQLDILNDWAMAADPHSVLLIEAIGGNGKSMLTWEWVTKHSIRDGTSWQGRFWYSFYEKGAIMADFCRHALAYMTGRHFGSLLKMKTPELADEILRELHSHPWLLVLDGLERILVNYHRIDAAEVFDDDANRPCDTISNRDPCASTRWEDDELLRRFASIAPSKIIITSRLTPRVFLNHANQTIPGVLRISLPGMRPPEAEELFRSLGIRGDTHAIQRYLATNCGCHPLVIGVLAGLVNRYLPDKGNFDTWAADIKYGAKLNLANLNLVQRRNHILHFSLDDLSDKSRELLCTLALIPESVDSATLAALNPHISQLIEADLENSDPCKEASETTRNELENRYQSGNVNREDSQSDSMEFHIASNLLMATVVDLEDRGLMKYDDQTRKYDLHPVVRSVAAGRLKAEDRSRYGQRAVDYFSQKSYRPYSKVKTLEDLRIGITLVRALINVGQFQKAAEAYHSNLSFALFFAVEAYPEIISLLRPLFINGWETVTMEVKDQYRSVVSNDAGVALCYLGEIRESLVALNSKIREDLLHQDWRMLIAGLHSAALVMAKNNVLAKLYRATTLCMDLAKIYGREQEVFIGHLFLFEYFSMTGQWSHAEATKKIIDRLWLKQKRKQKLSFPSADVEHLLARFQFRRGVLLEEQLLIAEECAHLSNLPGNLRDLRVLRGNWKVEQGDWHSAAVSYEEAVRMARQSGTNDSGAEIGLALANFHLGRVTDPHDEAERLYRARNPSHLLLAKFLLAIGDLEKAKKCALLAYRWAWADGEPHVLRFELNQSISLLQELNVPIPNLAAYDSLNDMKLPWEDALVEAIETLRVSARFSLRRLRRKRPRN